MGEDLFITLIVVIFKLWSPHELKILFKNTIAFILLIDPRENHGFEAEFCEDLCICTRVTEGIQLPANLRFDTKFFHKEGMTLLKVANDISVVCTSFIRRDHASV